MHILTRLLNRAMVLLMELVLRSLPPRALVILASAGGGLWFRMSRSRQRVSMENLRLAFGDRYTEAERREVAEASFRHFGRAMAELIQADRLFGSRGGPKRRFRYPGDGQGLLEAQAAGEAGMIVGGHMGSWEVGAYALRSLGIPTRAVVRTLDDPQLDRFITNRRGGEDAVIRKHGAARGMLRSFREGIWVAFLADQNAGRHGIFVDFFGVPAATVPTPAALNFRLGIPLFVGCCLQQPGKHLRYDLRIRRIPDPPKGLSEQDHILQVMQAIHAVLEEWIRDFPRQYNWSHRRWKTRPIDEQPGPRTPVYGAKQPQLRPRELAARSATQATD